MLMLHVDRKSSIPAYRQICERVIALVESGDLASGDRLPPTRRLAEAAGVHRSTVLRAYGELWSLGYLQSRPGSYSTIRLPLLRVTGDRVERSTAIDWEEATRADLGAWSPPRRVPDRDIIDFATLSADPRLTPVDALRRCLNAVMRERGRELLDYGDASGDPALKEIVMRRMRVHGIDVASDEVMITNGAQQGLDLVLRLLTSAEDRIVVESPTYAAALPLFRLYGLTLDCVPMLADGMDLDALEATLEKVRPRLVYTMPTFQNPTGISTSHEHRELLLRLCERHRVPLVEDGFEEDLKYFGKLALPLKSMDHDGAVIYLGTLSKVVFSGLRIGWIAAPRACIQRFVAIQRATSLSGVALAQAAAARLCESGVYDSYLRRLHSTYRKRMQAMLRGLAMHMPQCVEWTRPAGGSTLWLTIRTAASEDAIYDRLLRSGVNVTPGRPFFAAPSAEPHFRLSISCVNDEQIDEGCRRLGRALADCT
jgi:DNA-binding transcriptional MocR family regulator